MTELDLWKAVVLAVNYETRNVTLRKLPAGTMKNYTLTQEAANFMAVGQGDTVNVEVATSLAVYLRKASEPAAGAPASYMAVAPKGKPVISSVAVQEVNGTVVEVNYLQRLIQVAIPKGDTLTFKADTSMHNFNSVKGGDQVVLRFTEDMVVGLTKSH